MTTNLLAIGTGKGLFLARSEDDRRTWAVSGPHFPMTGVYAVAIDTRRSPARLLAGVDSSHFGPIVATSDDLGETWDEPDERPIAFPEDTEVALKRVWQIAPGPGRDSRTSCTPGPSPRACSGPPTAGAPTSSSGRCGTTRTGRSGARASAARRCTRSSRTPSDPDRVLIAMSTGGVYRTEDGGASWEASNKGIKAYFMPDPWPEFGQCVHKVAASPGRPEQLFTQNHHGVYRSDDGGATWSSIADGLPSDFGFAMVAHPRPPRRDLQLPARGRRAALPAGGQVPGVPQRGRRRDLAGALGRAADRAVLPQRAARRDVRGQRRDGRCLLRHPRRRRLREPGRGRALAARRRAPAGGADRPGGGGLR